jgi:hypothetical protein
MKFKSICPSLSPDALDDLFIRTMYCFGDDGGGGGGGGGGGSQADSYGYDDYDGGRFDDDAGFDDGDTGDTGGSDDAGFDDGDTGDTGDTGGDDDSSRGDNEDDDPFVGDEVDLTDSEIDDIVDDIIDDFVGDEIDFSDSITGDEAEEFIDSLISDDVSGLEQELGSETDIDFDDLEEEDFDPEFDLGDVGDTLTDSEIEEQLDDIDQGLTKEARIDNAIDAYKNNDSFYGNVTMDPSDPEVINDLREELAGKTVAEIDEFTKDIGGLTLDELAAEAPPEVEPEVEPEFETPPRDITDPGALDTEELLAEIRGEGTADFGDDSQTYQEEIPVEVNVPEVNPYIGDDADDETLPAPEPEDIFVGDEVAFPTDPYDDYDDVFGEPGGTDPFVGEEIAVPEENKISTTIDNLINAALSLPTPGSLIFEGLSKEFPKIAQAIKEGTYDPEFDYGDVDDITLDERVSYISPETGELNTRNFNIGDDERDQPYVDTYVNGKFTRVYGPIENLSKQFDPSEIRGVDFDEGDVTDTIPIIDELPIPEEAPETDFKELTSGTLSPADDPFVGDEIMGDDDLVPDIEIQVPEPEDPFVGDEIDYSDDSEDIDEEDPFVGDEVFYPDEPAPVAPVTGGGGDDTSTPTETTPPFIASPYTSLFGDPLQYNPFEGQDPFEYDTPTVTDPFRPEELFGSYTLSNDVAQGLADLVNAGYAPEYLEPISQMDEARREQEEIMALIGAQMPTGTPVSDEDFQYFELSPIEEAERLIAELSNDQS